MSIQGTLKDIGMVELLQMPVRERKNGVLEVSSDQGAAVLVYTQGVLTHSSLEDLAGEEAVYALVGWNEGRFKLDFVEADKPVNVQAKIENLIMEGIRRLDEQQNSAAAQEMTAGQQKQVDQYLSGVIKENDYLIFVGLSDLNHTNIIKRQVRDALPEALEQNIAIMLQLIRESTSHVEEDPLESLITQSRTYMIISQRLADGRYLIFACQRDVPLGELIFAMRGSVEGMDDILGT